MFSFDFVFDFEILIDFSFFIKILTFLLKSKSKKFKFILKNNLKNIFIDLDSVLSLTKNT